MSSSAENFGHYALKGMNRKWLQMAQNMPANAVGRRAALILRKVVRKSGATVIDAEVEGIRMRFHTEDNVCERKFLFMPQFYDVKERELIAETLGEGGIFVDVGANAGIYSLWAAHHLKGKGGRVVSIEPNPKVLDRLKFNAQVSGVSDIITPLQMGVADEAGYFTLVLDPTNLGGTSLQSDAQGVRAECDTLLSILNTQRIEKVDVLKIDVEGGEDRALIPFFEAAPESLFPRYIIIENSVDQWKQDLLSEFTKRGYQQALSTRMNLVFERA